VFVLGSGNGKSRISYHLREQLYFLATEGGDRRLGFTCPNCQHHALSSDFANVRREMTEDGDFFAPCPKCKVNENGISTKAASQNPNANSTGPLGRDSVTQSLKACR